MALARWQATIVDDAGNIQDGATVTVRQEISGTPLASLFSDRDGLVPTGNPITSDVDGFVGFHVAGGAYQITATKGGFTRTWRYVALGTMAEQDSDAVDITGGSIAGVTLELSGFLDLPEIAAPANPASNVMRTYAVDSGGTTKLEVKDSGGTTHDLTHFTQAGTGATLRTQGAKLRERVSVGDFGAVGDGVANDRTAFVNAYTQAVAVGEKLHVPLGNYNFTSDYTPALANFQASIAPGAEWNGTGLLRFDNLIPHQITPILGKDHISGIYDASYSAYENVFQRSSYVRADASGFPLVAQFGEGEAAASGATSWGGNFVGVASASGAVAIASEINPVVTAAGGAAYGQIIASAGSQPASAAIQIQSNENASRFTHAVIFNNGTHDVTTGSILRGTTGAAARGLDFSAMSFGTAEIEFPSFVVGPTVGSLNSAIRVDGSASGNPTISAAGSATNSNLNLFAKGTGTIQGGSLTSVAALPINCRTVAAVNFNSANSDTSLPIALPPGYTRYRINQIIISGASASISTATWGLFTAAGGGGTAISAAGQTISVTTASENTGNNMLVVAPATINQNLQSFNAATLFFRVGTAQGSAATATVTVTYTPVS